MVKRSLLLKQLASDYGFADTMEMLEAAVCDSVCPAICIKCGYTTDMEPDQDRGWCDECEANTVVSAMVLAGVI